MCITTSVRKTEQFESIYFETSLGISGIVYEDGLSVLSFEKVTNITQAEGELKRYYEDIFSKAVSYIFSKGAPIPKELAAIPTVLPYMFVVENATQQEIQDTFFVGTERLHSVVVGKTATIFRGSKIMVLLDSVDIQQEKTLIETLIFFREFKAQLERYLHIHRIVWEKIRSIVELQKIKGTEIESFRSELQAYQKTVNLIEARINQMPTYVKTRQKLTVINEDSTLEPVVTLRFEDLLDTHEYIKHLWTMTKNYLQSALDMLSALQSESTKTTISSLQLVTTIGVISGLIGYLGKDTFPPISRFGFIYLALLLFFTWIINTVISIIYKRRLYTLKQTHHLVKW